MEKNILSKTKGFFYNISRAETFLQAVFVGITAGIFVILFNFCITKLFIFIQHFLSPFSLVSKIVLFPLIAAFGGMVSGLLIFKIAPETKGSGIPYVKLTLSRLGKRIRVRSIFVKFAAGVAAIGSGMSLGREGPSVQLGAGAGALVSRIFKMNGTNQHNLIAAGAAAAIGATFNAPIAGTIFAVEELTQKFSPATLFTVLVSTVSAVGVSRHFSGEHPAFVIPSLENIPNVSLQSLAVFIILGVIAGCLGVLFAKMIFINQKIFDRLSVPLWVKPAIAGFLIGITGLFLPHVLGSGSSVIEQLLLHKFAIGMICVIFAVKFFVTPLCFSSGAAGGIFFPMLMLGAFLGYFTGVVSNYLGIETNLVTISIVGMGAFLAAVARTPITAIVMVFELTGDYSHILPVMFCVAIADLTAEKFNHAPIYSTLILKQAAPTKEKQILSELKAVDAMDIKIDKIPQNASLSSAMDMMNKNEYGIIPVVDYNGKLSGSITKEDLEDYVLHESDTSQSVETIMNPEPVFVRQEDDLYKTLFILHSNGIQNIIVTDKDGYAAGILSRKQIMFEETFEDIL